MDTTQIENYLLRITELLENLQPKVKLKQTSLPDNRTLLERINPFVNDYAGTMIQDFLNYWTEKNCKGKERWQLQQVFDPKRRLETWASRSLTKKPKYEEINT